MRTKTIRVYAYFAFIYCTVLNWYLHIFEVNNIL